MKHKLRWGSVLLYCLVIFYISSLDLGEAIPKEMPFRDRILSLSTDLHIPEFMVLGGLLYWATLDAPVSILSSALYGVTDELHQHFIPNRFMDPYDITADWLGSVIGVVIMVFIMRGFPPFIHRLNTDIARELRK